MQFLNEELKSEGMEVNISKVFYLHSTHETGGRAQLPIVLFVLMEKKLLLKLKIGTKRDVKIAGGKKFSIFFG